MAKKKAKRIERELASCLSIERLIQAHLRNYVRPRQAHGPLREAVEHIISERVLLQQAIAGNRDAQAARKLTDATSEPLGE